MPASTTTRTEDPIHRVSYSFAREGGDLIVDTLIDGGGHLPEHFHPSLEEDWEVLEGEIDFKLDGSWRRLTAPDGPVTVARNVRHELRNSSGQRAHLRAVVRPAGRLEEFLVETAEAAREGLYNRRNMPTSIRGAIWIAGAAQRYRDETVMCSPPPALQRVITPLLARLGR